MKVGTGATDEQIASLNAQAEALEKVGVVTGGNITQTQSQLATFNLQTETIKTLTPAILDYVTAEKGAAAGADEFKQMTNGLAQALNGNFGSLTRVGFVIDENTKKIVIKQNKIPTIGLDTPYNPIVYQSTVFTDKIVILNTLDWTSATNMIDRKEEYDEIATSTNKIIVATYGVAAVGINIPRIFNLVLIEPGKSFVRVIQSIGRGIRKAEDKDHVQIYDITSSCKFAKRHLTQRKAFYKEANYPFDVEKLTYR
jgi:hypothetical protein